MHFREWLLVEIGVSDDGVMFLYGGGKGVATFRHNGTKFTVNFVPVDSWVMGTKVPDVYFIEFLGPRGTNTTGQAGASAVPIYSKLLGSINRLVQATNVNGLTFSAYESKMAAVYNRLLGRFGGNFVKVSPTEYIRRDVVDKLPKNHAGKQV